MFGWFRRRQEHQVDLILSSMHQKIGLFERQREVQKAFQSIGRDWERGTEPNYICINAITTLLKEIIATNGLETEKMTEEELLATGVFSFVCCDLIVGIYRAEFTSVAIIALNNILGRGQGPEICARRANLVGNLYNFLAHQDNAFNTIQRRFADWIADPSTQNFVNLVAIYQVVKQSRIGADILS